MKLALLKGIPKDEVAETRANFLSAAPFRKHLIKTINNEINSIYNEMENEDWYDCPNYGLKQSGRIQRVKALKQIISWCENEEK